MLQCIEGGTVAENLKPLMRFEFGGISGYFPRREMDQNGSYPCMAQCDQPACEMKLTGEMFITVTDSIISASRYVCKSPREFYYTVQIILLVSFLRSPTFSF